MATERLHYLDALRVISIGLVVFFHSGLVFTPFFEFVITNQTRSLDLSIASVALLHTWNMPLLFFVAGMTATFSLHRRSVRSYIKERVMRLLIPFISGLVFVVPPQVYFDRVSRGFFTGSLIDFYPFYFTEGFRQGLFTWHHLWFVLYLFVISLVALPVLRMLRHHLFTPLHVRLGSLLSRRGAVFLGAVPLAVTEIAFRGKWPGYYNLYADWANVSLFLLLFVYGYVVMADRRILRSIYEQWRRALLIAVSITGLLLVIVKLNGEPPALSYGDVLYYPYYAVMALNVWSWIVGLIGLAHATFRRPSPVWSYAMYLAYPFYIIHQTVLVGLAFYITPGDAGIVVKYVLIAALTFVFTVPLVEFLCSLPSCAFLLGVKRRRGYPFGG